MIDGSDVRPEAPVIDRCPTCGQRVTTVNARMVLEQESAVAEVERLRKDLTSVRVWAEIVEERHSDERVQRFARMLLDLLDGDAPDITTLPSDVER